MEGCFLRCVAYLLRPCLRAGSSFPYGFWSAAIGGRMEPCFAAVQRQIGSSADGLRGVFCSAGRASLLPTPPLAYSLEQLGGLAAGLCLLSGFGLAAFQLRSRAEGEGRQAARANPSPPRARDASRGSGDFATARLCGAVDSAAGAEALLDAG
ncbi:hypothetical protein [Verrucomicrobium sp. 3C]|uniref:hypothetical protein n=1 Tax=Verrucomicrobium sp. 3C TaxID=1134055 RepID=UPI00035DEBCB|nr:hypothetical protein [Verrucomicrobium sp. 3C]